jgi:hypothetical protein
MKPLIDETAGDNHFIKNKSIYSLVFGVSSLISASKFCPCQIKLSGEKQECLVQDELFLSLEQYYLKKMILQPNLWWS